MIPSSLIASPQSNDPLCGITSCHGSQRTCICFVQFVAAIYLSFVLPNLNAAANVQNVLVFIATVIAKSRLVKLLKPLALLDISLNLANVLLALSSSQNIDSPLVAGEVLTTLAFVRIALIKVYPK
jgi:hypothetical protein